MQFSASAFQVKLKRTTCWCFSGTYLVGLHFPRLLGSLTTQPVGVVLAALINAIVPQNHITCPRLTPRISNGYNGVSHSNLRLDTEGLSVARMKICIAAILIIGLIGRLYGKRTP